jgi:hypothetical protein
MEKEKDKFVFWASNSQSKLNINKPKMSIPSLKENLISNRHRAEISESQTQSLLHQVVELQCKLILNLKKCLGLLLGNDRILKSWNGDL